jgi:PAS domain S-box-containing protein
MNNIIEKESFWKRLGNHFPTSVLIIKKSGEIVYKNSAFEDLINNKTNHNTIYMFIDTDDMTKFSADLNVSQHEKKIIFNTFKFKKINEEILYFIYYIFPVDQNYFAIFLINQTEIYSENITLHNIINTVSDPIFVKDEQHTWIYINQGFAEALGHHPTEILGKSDADFFSKEESDIFYKLDRKTFKTQKTTINEETFTTPACGTRIISTKKSIFKTLTNKKILVGVIRDITEVTEARKSLNKYAHELKREVGVRTRQLESKKIDLEHAIERLQKLNSDLDCFAHMCCHELREPLRTISSFSKLAIDENGNEQNKITHFLNTIHQGTLRMDLLIKSILNYSTNGLSTNLMSSFAPHDLINEVTNMLDAQIKEKNAVIHFNKMPAIHADRLQVLQLFQNLITNAIKFCAPSRIPVIHIKAKPIDKFIQFKLKDNGIGIAKKYHKELFMPFKKFHSRSEGSMYGIGLSLCKKIVTNHGGSIKFSSRENLGTTFTFLLPSSEIN